MNPKIHANPIEKMIEIYTRNSRFLSFLSSPFISAAPFNVSLISLAIKKKRIVFADTIKRPGMKNDTRTAIGLLIQQLNLY